MNEPKHGILQWTVICALVSVFIASCSNLPEPAVKTTNENRAETVIRALYMYQKAHGTFPSKLADLIPEYLDTLPTPLGSKDFFYSTDSVNGFNLSFEIRPHYGCGYSDHYKVWECSYGD